MGSFRWLLLCSIGISLFSLLGWTQAPQGEPKPVANPADVLLKFSFEEGVQRWEGVGTNANVNYVTEPANVHGGKGALKFGYRIQGKETAGAAVILRTAALEKMKSMRLWVKPDHNTTMVVVLQEKTGGRYLAFFYVYADVWQEIALAPEDFLLSQSEGDPKDPNGKLDLDQVETLGVGDWSQWLTRQEGEQIDKLFPIRRGDHTMYVDDIVVSSESLPANTRQQEKETFIDTLSRPQPFWTPMGIVSLHLFEGKPLTGKCLKMDYQHTPDTFIAVGRTFSHSAFRKEGKIAFSVAALKPTRLVVQLEEKGGGKYLVFLNLPGENEIREITLGMEEFQAASDSKDKNNHLDPEEIQRVYFMDITGIQDKVTEENSLYINNLRAIAP